MYRSPELLQRIIGELQKRRTSNGAAGFDAPRKRVQDGFFNGPDECVLRLQSIGVNADGRRSGYELVLDCQYTGTEWRIGAYHIDNLTPAQMMKTAP